MTTVEKTDIATRAAKFSLALTSLNVVVKVSVGFASGSMSVIAEGLQSTVDILVAFGILQAIRIASRPPDDSHPYGHGKAELLIGLGQMILVLLTAGFIVVEIFHRFTNPTVIKADIGMVAMAVSLVLNLIISTRLKHAERETNSAAIRSEILHIRGDSYASLGILVGLALVYLTGIRWLDPLVAVFFSGMVIVSALKQLIEILHPLMDGALPAEDLKILESYLTESERVRDFHRVRTRFVGSQRHVDLHIMLDDDLTFVEAHDIAEEIEAGLSKQLEGAVVNAHYEPYHAELEHQRIAHADQNRV